MPLQVTHTAPFDAGFVSDLSALARTVFPDLDLDELAFRLANMPDASVQVIAPQGKLVAFKIGYAVGKRRYHSWLGGVAASHRRQGFARSLMDQQHAWAASRGYTAIETASTNANVTMLELNLAAGFQVIGMYTRGGEPRVILRKKLSTDEPIMSTR